MLVCLNKAFIPNFSFLGTLEVAQILLPGMGGVVSQDLIGTGTETELGNYNIYVKRKH